MSLGTVLVAEDNETLRSALAAALRAKGYNVQEAENGAEAVRLAGGHAPDLILLDLMMPVLDGWSAARELQENPVTAGIPRLAITASHLDPANRNALSGSFALVLQKPIRLGDLLAAIEGQLSARTIAT